MNFNQYTRKSLEAVQGAQALALEHHHQQMEQIHLLLALLQQEGGLAPQILRKLGVTVESLEAAAQAELGKLPRVSGSREVVLYLPGGRRCVPAGGAAGSQYEG